MVQLGDADLKVLKVDRTILSKDQTREYNPLASPTTPFQFEPRHPPHHSLYDSAFDEAAGLQSSIQLQLLNYIRTLHGAQQPAEMNNVYSHQLPAAYLQPPQQIKAPAAGGGTADHHPTIALLQQRFQRLERDKEMRQARQLYSNHQGALETRFPSTSSPTSTGPCSNDCNLQLSLPHNTSTGLRSRNLSSTSSSSCSRAGDMSQFIRLGELNEDGRHKTKMFMSLLPTDTDRADRVDRVDRVTSGVSTYPRGSLEFSSSSALHPYEEQRETQTLLRDWKTGRQNLPVVVDDEVDTSLHL